MTKKQRDLLNRLRKALHKDPKAADTTAGLLRHFKMDEIDQMEAALEQAVRDVRGATH